MGTRLVLELENEKKSTIYLSSRGVMSQEVTQVRGEMRFSSGVTSEVA